MAIHLCGGAFFVGCSEEPDVRGRLWFTELADSMHGYTGSSETDLKKDLPEHPCSPGTELISSTGPDGLEQYCARKDEAGNIVKHGLYRSWDIDGQRLEEGNYRNGLKEGPWKKWIADEFMSEGGYRTGKKEGNWVEWDFSGIHGFPLRKGVGKYKNGEKEGCWITWHSDEQKQSEGEYRNGKHEGPWTMWDQEGFIIGEGKYKNGKRTGLWTSWDENGKKTEEVEYKTGIRQ